MRRISGKDMTS